MRIVFVPGRLSTSHQITVNPIIGTGIRTCTLCFLSMNSRSCDRCCMHVGVRRRTSYASEPRSYLIRSPRFSCMLSSVAQGHVGCRRNVDLVYRGPSIGLGRAKPLKKHVERRYRVDHVPGADSEQTQPLINLQSTMSAIIPTLEPPFLSMPQSLTAVLPPSA